MKQLLIVLLILGTITAYGQKTKRIKNEINSEITESFYVLKSDNSIKHGLYKKIENGTKILEGYYNHNVKDSIWSEYFVGTGNLACIGEYNNDKKVGVWKFYNYEGKGVQKYDYDTKKLIYYNDDDHGSNEYEVKTDDAFKKMKLDRPPMYLGGGDAMYEDMFILNYPQLARESGIQGTVVISFIIGIDGYLSEYVIEEGIGGGCDEEALRVVKALTGNWLPGILDGNAVAVKYSFPIKFTLTN